MKEYIKNNINNIIIIFLLMSPLLDLLTGINLHYNIFIITPGMIIRIIFLVFIIYSIIFIYNKKKVLPYYIILLIYMIIYLIGTIIIEDSKILSEIQNLIKVFYFPIILLSIYNVKDEIRISNLVLLTMLFTYLITIFIPLILDVGYKSYEITKAGTLGFYNSANEIGGIISILTPIMFIIIIESKKIIPKLILGIMYLVVILMMGTKTPLLVLIITLTIHFIYYFIYWIKNKKYKNIGISLSIIIIGIISLILIIPRTNFYKNIQTHLDFLGVNNIYEVFQKEELIDHFIFSQRLTFLKDKYKVYKDSNIYEKLFGIGTYQDNKQLKEIEIDYLDIIYNQGLIGFILFFSILIFIIYKIIKQKRVYTYKSIMLSLSIFLILILSFFTGHILVSPSVSIICCILLISKIKKDKLYNLYIGKLSKEIDSNNIIININDNELPHNNISFIWYKLTNYKVYDKTYIKSKKYLEYAIFTTDELKYYKDIKNN